MKEFNSDGFMELRGREPGRASVILVGVHGNERCGVEAIENLLPTLEIERGTVFLGYGNPRAIAKGIRYTDANLNRMFKKDSAFSTVEKQSYEYARAQILKKYFDQAEVLFDIHSSNTPDSRPFLICERNAQEIIKHLPIDTVVFGFDEVEPGGTDSYMNSIGKIGICVECGCTEDPSAIDVAGDAIQAFLVARGHTSGIPQQYIQSQIQMYFLYHTKTADFTLVKQFRDFEEVRKEEIIGMDGEESVMAPKDGIILFAHNPDAIGSEAFLLGKVLK